MGQDQDVGAVPAQVPASSPSLVSAGRPRRHLHAQQTHVHAAEPVWIDTWATSDARLFPGPTHVQSATTEFRVCGPQLDRSLVPHAAQEDTLCGGSSPIGTERGVN